jgi:hypothetical protein
MANNPHGGALKDLLVRDAGSHEQLLEESRTLQDIFLTEVSGFGFSIARIGADGSATTL